jgi:hypothetical protein
MSPCLSTALTMASLAFPTVRGSADRRVSAVTSSHRAVRHDAFGLWSRPAPFGCAVRSAREVDDGRRVCEGVGGGPAAPSDDGPAGVHGSPLRRAERVTVRSRRTVPLPQAVADALAPRTSRPPQVTTGRCSPSCGLLRAFCGLGTGRRGLGTSASLVISRRRRHLPACRRSVIPPVGVTSPGPAARSPERSPGSANPIGQLRPPADMGGAGLPRDRAGGVPAPDVPEGGLWDTGEGPLLRGVHGTRKVAIMMLNGLG